MVIFEDSKGKCVEHDGPFHTEVGKFAVTIQSPRQITLSGASGADFIGRSEDVPKTPDGHAICGGGLLYRFEFETHRHGKATLNFTASGASANSGMDDGPEVLPRVLVNVN